MSDQLTLELRRGDGDPAGVDQQKDTEGPNSAVSHTLEPPAVTGGGLTCTAEEERVIRLMWPDKTVSVGQIEAIIHRNDKWIRRRAVAFGLELPKPGFQERHAESMAAWRAAAAKLRAIKRLERGEALAAEGRRAVQQAIADFHAKHGNFTDDPRALPPQPFKPLGWEPRPVGERLRFSPVGCAAAMTAGN